MLQATVVTSESDLLQIHQLNTLNYRHNVSEEEKNIEGFVSWLYPVELLEQMHQLAPSVVVKDDDKVIAYALVTLKEAAPFHKDLQGMFDNLAHIDYMGKPLAEYDFYCMGQVCVDKAYRGMGVFNMLYQHHKKIHSNGFDFILTEVSLSNIRSQKAHEKVGFKTIYSYADSADTWNVVVWDWK